MEPVSNAVLGEFVRRSISFLLAKCERPPASTVHEDLKRLRNLLLRSCTILEEAERRQVGSRAMLLQLRALRDKTFKGYYVLDVVRCRSSLSAGGGASDGGHDEVTGEEAAPANRRAFALSSPFSRAKRARFSSNSSETESSSSSGAAALMVSGASPEELQQTVHGLEAMIGDMKELVVLLMGYPTLYRQPYSAHLFVEKFMFGRQVEKERVMEFLLHQIDPPASASGTNQQLGVLPIVGPMHIGKTTLVEHVCDDERVHSHFSMILFYTCNDLKDETVSSFREKCVIKHQNNSISSQNRLLIVIELLDDVDDETWERLYSSSERSMTRGSKMIITSRSKNITRLGTTEALKLQCLSVEAYWYFFKMLIFGSDDPGQHPKMEVLAMEVARVQQGSFFSALIGAVLLRANFNTESWSRALIRLKQYAQKNASLIGEYPDDVMAKDNRRYTWSIIKPRPDKYFMLDDIRHINPAVEEVPKITMNDLQSGCTQPQGKYEILYWKSPIPPYLNYVATCDIVDM